MKKTIKQNEAASEFVGRRRAGEKWSAKMLVFCGLMAALCTVLLYVGALSVFDLTAVVVCALITMLIVVEAGTRYAWLTVCAAGVLSLVLLPVKLPAVTYILIGGIYPIVKSRFEKVHYIISWILKVSAMGTMMLILIVLAEVLFKAEESYFAPQVPVILIGIAFLVVYDMALSACITFYIVKLRKRLGLKKIF